MAAPRWNGEPCEAEHVIVIVADNPDAPQYWARDLIGQERKALRVRYGGDEFFLDDEDGTATHKVFEQGGSPRFGHRELAVEIAMTPKG